MNEIYFKLKNWLDALHLDIDLYCDAKWSSVYSEHRSLIRKDIYKKTKQKTVLDLSKKPEVPAVNISISHCPTLGGYILSKESVGVDFEQHQRLSPSVIKRISFDEELQAFSNLPKDSLKALWTIKESVLKTLPEIENTTLSEVKLIEIDDYKFDDQDYYLVTKSSLKDQNFINYSAILKSHDVVVSLSLLV